MIPEQMIVLLYCGDSWGTCTYVHIYVCIDIYIYIHMSTYCSSIESPNPGTQSRML